jgi:amino acid permease
MGKKRNGVTVLLVCCLCVLCFLTPAYAYIDPNAAGLVSQILTPLLIAAAAIFAFFRKQVIAVLDGLSRRLRRRADVER